MKGRDVRWLADLPGGDVVTTWPLETRAPLQGGRGRSRAWEWPKRAPRPQPHIAGESRKGPGSRAVLRLSGSGPGPRARRRAVGPGGELGSGALSPVASWLLKGWSWEPKPSWSDGETQTQRGPGAGVWDRGRGALALAPAQLCGWSAASTGGLGGFQGNP